MQNRNAITLFQPVITRREEIFLSQSLMEGISNSEREKLVSCVQETNETIKTYSSFPGFEHNAQSVEGSRNIIDGNIYKRLSGGQIKINESILLRLLANEIKAQQAGNCYEYSLFCYSLLARQGIKSEIFRIKGGNHIFLVAFRDQKLPANDFTNWNKEAIVIDPFFSSVYMAHEIPTKLQSCCYDQESNKVSYIAFNSAIHTLDNGVLQELVEDWQNILVNNKKQDTVNVMKI